MAKRQSFASNEVLRRAFKYISRNTTFPARVRHQAQLSLNQFPANSRPAMIKERCTETGRGRGVIAKEGLCRVSNKLGMCSWERIENQQTVLFTDLGDAVHTSSSLRTVSIPSQGTTGRADWYQEVVVVISHLFEAVLEPSVLYKCDICVDWRSLCVWVLCGDIDAASVICF